MGRDHGVKKDADNNGLDMVNVLATQNAQRFGTVYQAVGKYLEKNGRRWVGMQGIFAFAAV